jgi:hypothetical protein
MEQQKKIYLGNAKPGKSFDWGQTFRGAITLDGLKEIFEQHGFTGNKNGKKYIPIDIVVGDKPDNFGNTLNITVNTWKPDQKNTSADNGGGQAVQGQGGGPNIDDIPF